METRRTPENEPVKRTSVKKKTELRKDEASTSSPDRPSVADRSTSKTAGMRTKFAAVVAGVAGVALAIGITSALASPQADQPSTQEAPAQTTATSAKPTDDGQTKKMDLSWRNTEFAADPNRDNTWNFEPNGRKVVYLTFDDGPSKFTPKVLEILDKYGCKATFFVTGLNPDYYGYIREAYDRGHTIGLHSFSHDYAAIYSSASAYYTDLEAIGQVVSDQIGYVPAFIRFPGGSSNEVSKTYTTGIMSFLANDVSQYGYQYYDWNVSSGDGGVIKSDEVFKSSTSHDTFENIILLMHDANNKQSTINALPRVIEYYQAQGYTFEAIDRTTPVPHHGIAN